MPDVDGAVALARELVERRLAAGVNVLPGALSVYRWEGEVRQAGECLLLAQVDASAFAGFRDFVTGSHPYQVPCVVALPIVDGHAPFLAWIGENSIPVPR
jgi:periplasmic divalent cation tolerance protein